MISLLRRRRWSLAWLLAILAVGAALAWLASVPLLRGEPAPTLALETLEGRRWSLADADAPLVWVNFWAVSCEPCRIEMPAMQRLADAYRGRLEIIGVNWGEERDVVDDFVERYAIDYPILLDPGLTAYYRWSSLDGLPRHYFIGPEGTVLREIIGPLDPARMLGIVEELLDG